MANRESGLSRPSPGTKGVKNPDMSAEKTCDWPGAAGSKGPKMNRVGGFHEVKVSAKQDMADDIYGQGPAMMGAPVMAQMPPELLPGGMPIGIPGGSPIIQPVPGMRPDPYSGPPIRQNPGMGRFRRLPPIRGRGRVF